MKRFGQWLLVAIIVTSFGATAANVKPATPVKENPKVRLTTTVGIIDVELYPDKAPGTVKNFLAYVDSGFYNGTLFHRIIKGFMIQGGGLSGHHEGDRVVLEEKSPRAPIKNEANNGLKNLTGTIAMARMSDPDSASAQFFINTANNSQLDHKNETPQGWGYCVFGKVIKGMEVVRTIESTPTQVVSFLENVPTKDMIILNAERIGKTK